MKNKIINLIKKIMGMTMPITLSKMLFKHTQNKNLDLTNPKTFNEKLMWLKFNNYNNNKDVWRCSDKYFVREYAKEHGINEDNLPKIIAIYRNADEIDFEKLPEKFALKCTHGCGFNIICMNKNNLDIQDTKKKLNKWLNTKFGYETAETHYMHIKPRIICEEFIENKKDEYPIDYKIYCFNGKAKITLVCTNRKEHYETSFYNMNWERVHLRDNESKDSSPCPKTFHEMIKIAEKLSKQFPFVRMDFYEYKGKAILGEMTFTPAGCLAKYTEEGSLILGNMFDNLY